MVPALGRVHDLPATLAARGQVRWNGRASRRRDRTGPDFECCGRTCCSLHARHGPDIQSVNSGLWRTVVAERIEEPVQRVVGSLDFHPHRVRFVDDPPAKMLRNRGVVHKRAKTDPLHNTLDRNCQSSNQGSVSFCVGLSRGGQGTAPEPLPKPLSIIGPEPAAPAAIGPRRAFHLPWWRTLRTREPRVPGVSCRPLPAADQSSDRVRGRFS